MKKITALALSICIILCFSRYSQTPKQDPNQSNPDSVKKIIIALNDECYHAYGNPEKFKTFCQDSMFAVGDNSFFNSSNALSHDLSRILVFPHDYSFQLFGNTAIISYLFKAYEIINGDTIFYNLRNLRTFVMDKEAWKIAANASTVQTVNYFKPIVDKHVKDYSSYVGIYQLNDRQVDTIFTRDGKLYDKMGFGDTYDFAVNENEYMIKDDLSRLSFGKDSKGAVAYYTITKPDGQYWKCPKIK
jgi:hypothetical protein